MSYLVYKLMHFFGIFVMITALAGSGMHILAGGSRGDAPHRKLIGITHGVAALLILTGGFGMLARLGIVQGGLPGWVIFKLAIWVALGAALTVAHRGRKPAGAVLIAVPLLALLAGWAALYKPF